MRDSIRTLFGSFQGFFQDSFGILVGFFFKNLSGSLRAPFGIVQVIFQDTFRALLGDPSGIFQGFLSDAFEGWIEDLLRTL